MVLYIYIFFLHWNLIPVGLINYVEKKTSFLNFITRAHVRRRRRRRRQQRLRRFVNAAKIDSSDGERNKLILYVAVARVRPWCFIYTLFETETRSAVDTNHYRQRTRQSINEKQTKNRTLTTYRAQAAR